MLILCNSLLHLLLKTYKHSLQPNLSFASCVIKKFKFQGIFFMYAQVKKTFLRSICASGDITYISVFSSEKISLEWEIFNLFVDFYG